MVIWEVSHMVDIVLMVLEWLNIVLVVEVMAQLWVHVVLELIVDMW